MKRRVFIVTTVVAGTALALLPQRTKSNIKIELFKTLEAVQQVLFPEGLDAPSAKAFGATAYLANVSTHSSFLKSDLRFLKRGAQELMNEHNNFLTLSPKEQEEALRAFVNNNEIGENWVSFVLYFTLEALLADPIYGGNKNASGWQWLNHHAGVPRPKVPFAQNLKGEVI
jgi:gluconate 2-dehydrogenase gamma chain